jgi:hypothetical protein
MIKKKKSNQEIARAWENNHGIEYRKTQRRTCGQKLQESNSEGHISMQELECIALKNDAFVVMQGLGSTRDLRRVEFLVFVRGKRGIHECDERRDRQRVGGGVGRAEEVGDRIACEIQPLCVRANPKK